MTKILEVNYCYQCGNYDKEMGDCSELDRPVNSNVIPEDCPLRNKDEYLKAPSEIATKTF